MSITDNVMSLINANPSGISYDELEARLDCHRQSLYQAVSKLRKAGDITSQAGVHFPARAIVVAEPEVEPPEEPSFTLQVFRDHVRMSHNDAAVLLGGRS